MNLIAKYKLRKYHRRLREAEKALAELNKKPAEKKSHQIIEKEPLIKTTEIRLSKSRVVKENSIVNKNANLVLLLAIVILLAVIGAASIFYNQEFTKIKKSYDSSIDEINKLTKDLTTKLKYSFKKTQKGKL